MICQNNKIFVQSLRKQLMKKMMKKLRREPRSIR